MKKLNLIIAAAALLLCMGSCSNSEGPLSASSAKKAVEKEAMFAKDSQVMSFGTGFYEVTPEALQKLARLSAAGMITYTTEKAVEQRTERVWQGYWTGYVSKTVSETHVFAQVELTDAGRKFEIEEPTMLRADKLKDFASNKDYEEAVPDYMDAFDNAFGKEEVEAPAVAEAVEEVVEVVDTAAVEEVAIEEEPAPVQTDPNARYNALRARVSEVEHFMLCGRFEVVKAKEVLCTEDMYKEGRGSCTLLYKFVDKTPFGFVSGSPAEGYIQASQVKFRLYQDMGWTVAE